MRKKTESRDEKAKADAEEAEDPETHQDIKNHIKVLEQNVKYRENVVKFLEDVKRGTEAREEAKAEEEAAAEENAPATEETPAEGAEKAKTEEAKEADPDEEKEAKTPEEAAPEAKAEEKKTADSKEVESNEPKPIGTGVFGNIFNQFKGKVKEAFDFLMKHKSGDLLGVFHRDEVGDIDLVWGDEKKGLMHIIENHIKVKNPDFANIDEAMQRIEDIINSGNVVKEGNAKSSLRKTDTEL